MNNRIPTSHVGSLIRPAEFAALLRLRIEGGIDEAAYEAALCDAVAAIVKRQVEIGLDIVSDGEFGKSISWAQYALERLAGFTHAEVPREARESTVRSGLDYRRFPEFYAEYMKSENLRPAWQTPKLWVNDGQIRYRGQEAIARDIANFKAGIGGAGVTGFMPAVAPASAVALARTGITAASANICSQWPQPYTRNTGRFSTPTSFCKSTMRICR